MSVLTVFGGVLTQNILTDIAVCYNSNDAAAHAVFIMIAALFRK